MKQLAVILMLFGLFGCGKNSKDTYEHLLQKAMNDLQAKQSAHQALWGLGTADRWDINQDDGNLVFTFTNKVVTCPAQIIGSFNSDKGTWMWAWHNKSIAEQLTRDSRKLLELGRSKGYEKLTEPVWTGTEDDAWQMAALATLHCNAQGAYRGPSSAGHLFVFMTFGEVKITKLEQDAQPGAGDYRLEDKAKSQR
jgi:hypothetical protein